MSEYESVKLWCEAIGSGGDWATVGHWPRLQELWLILQLTLAVNTLGPVAVWAFRALSSALLGLCLPILAPRTLRGGCFFLRHLRKTAQHCLVFQRSWTFGFLGNHLIL